MNIGDINLNNTYDITYSILAKLFSPVDKFSEIFSIKAEIDSLDVKLLDVLIEQVKPLITSKSKHSMKQNDLLENIIQHIKINTENNIDKKSYITPEKYKVNQFTKDVTEKSINLDIIFSQFRSEQKNIHNQYKDSNQQIYLDALDTLLQQYLSTIPAHKFVENIEPYISLYDYIKVTTTLVQSVYQFAKNNNLATIESKQESLLFIQGDFYGIQDFIFSEGSQTNKNAAKILRGRSFSVSLLTELVAIHIIEELGLNSFAQIINAAGKFIIVAPNSKDNKEKIDTIRKTVDKWFLDNTFGTSGFGIVAYPASTDNLTHDNYNKFIKGLFGELEKIKYRKFDLLANDINVFQHVKFTDKGVCPYNKYLPADTLDRRDENKEESYIAKLSDIQIKIGQELVKKDLLVIIKNSQQDNKQIIRDKLNKFDLTFDVELDFLGYIVGFGKLPDSFKQEEKYFSPIIDNLTRLWDISLANEECDGLWHGFARRNINSYVAKWSEDDIENKVFVTSKKYGELDDKPNKYNLIKTFNVLAGETRTEEKSQNNDTYYKGQKALAVLKGDVDNLGSIFQSGLENNNLVKMVALSREINNFFALYLPYLCQHGDKESGTKFPYVYTVFAGGDDFFLIGNWKTIMELAAKMAQDFAKFSGNNKDIHFSAGVSLFKPGVPLKTIAEMGEDGIHKAKNSGKDSISIFNATVKWNEYRHLLELSNKLDHKLGIGYIYGLLNLCNMSVSQRPQDAIWQSYFRYRTYRLCERLNSDDNMYNTLLMDIYDQGIKKYADEINKKETDKIKNKQNNQTKNEIEPVYSNPYKISLMYFLYQIRI